MLSRPSDNGHTPFGDIFFSESPDLVHWGRHRHVMGPEPLDLGVDEDRRRPDPDRDRRGLARDLPRRADLLQRLRLLDGRRAARPRRAVARRRPRPRLPALAAGAVRAGRRRAERRLPRAPRSSTPRRSVTIYYGGADTVVCLAHGTSRSSSPSSAASAGSPRVAALSPRVEARPRRLPRRVILPHGCAIDQTGPDEGLRHRCLAELEAVQQQSHGQPAHPQLVDGHGRELRGHSNRAEVDVVVLPPTGRPGHR